MRAKAGPRATASGGLGSPTLSHAGLEQVSELLKIIARAYETHTGAKIGAKA